MTIEQSAEDIAAETANFTVTNSDMPTVEPKAEPEVKADDKTPAKTDDGEVSGDKPKEEAKKEENKTSDDATAGSDTTDDDTKPKGKGRFQKRITKVVREREELRTKSESLEARNKELEAKLATRQDKLDEPKEGDFDTYDEYLDAVDKHENSSSTESEKPEPKPEVKENDKGELSESQKSALAVIQENTQDAKETYPDFDDVALAKDVDITGDMLEALAECDDPAKVMYQLGKDKTLATEIANKSAKQQFREIMRLDLSVKVKPEKPVNKSNAAEPITPVAGSDSKTKSASEESFTEYEARRNKEENKVGDAW